MLSNDAYTFRRKSLLAVALSWVGGFTNVVALITCGQTVSHQTGNTTHLGRGLGAIIGGHSGPLDGVGAEAAISCFMVLLFFAGAAGSGLLTEWARRSGRSSKYVVPITLELILLSIVLLALLIWPDPIAARPLAIYTIVGLSCLAMGLQNGTITRISGSVVRTTHLTGVITDMGLESAHLAMWIATNLRQGHAHRLRRMLPILRRQPSAQRLALLAAIFTSFFLGITVGTIAQSHLGPAALLLPIAFLTFLVVQPLLVPIATIIPLDAGHSLADLLPERWVGRIAVFSVHSARKIPHRLPDLLAWSEHLPAGKAVAVLMIDPLTQLDRNAAAALLAAMEAVRSRGRRLIVGGITHKQSESLRAEPGGQRMDSTNFAPDLEMAMARAINAVTSL